ncbi:MAG: dipeptidase [Gemmatimonadaceae bacterium]
MTDPAARAARLYREAIVVDAHNDLPSRVLDDGYDPDVRHAAGFGPDSGHTDLPRLLESGVTAQFMAAWVDAPYARRGAGASFARALELIDVVHAFVARHPGVLRLATTAAEVRRAKAEGRVAILIGVEGGHAIECSLDNLRELYRRGARYLTLTWNNGNEWAGSSIGVGGTRTGGLTPFGREVVREMNRLGMLVDLSHASDATFDDAVAASAEPVVATHSCARALNDHPRNLTDAQLRAVAGTGGVVGINFYARFLDPAYLAAAPALDAALARVRRDAEARPGATASSVRAAVARARDEGAARIPPTPLSLLVDHVVHVATVAGVDHVALGSDFDGLSALPEGMEDVTRLPRLADALLGRGLAADEVTKVLGGNFLRVMERVLDRGVGQGSRG